MPMLYNRLSRPINSIISVFNENEKTFWPDHATEKKSFVSHTTYFLFQYGFHLIGLLL